MIGFLERYKFNGNTILVLTKSCISYFLLSIILFSVFPKKGIEDLCTKRDELHRQIMSEEEEKTKIQNDIRILTERLAKITESLSKKYAAQNDYDKTISETEAAYMKVKFKFSESSWATIMIVIVW